MVVLESGFEVDKLCKTVGKFGKTAAKGIKKGFV